MPRESTFWSLLSRVLVVVKGTKNAKSAAKPHSICRIPTLPLCTVELVVLATVFSLSWPGVVMQCSLVFYHGISHLSLVF